MWRIIATLGAVAAALCLAGPPNRNSELLFGQCRSEQQIAIGNILVASEKLADPNFSHTVVLIVQYDQDDGTVGLILNRRADIPLSRIFPKIKHATADPTYLGGPVAITAGQALLRLPNETDQATHVIGDVYVTGKKDLIEKSIASRADPSKFRVYLGYAGWAPGQLETEVRLGAWSVLHLGPKIVFDEDPDSLWSRLVHESHMQIANSGNSPKRATGSKQAFDVMRHIIAGPVLVADKFPHDATVFNDVGLRVLECPVLVANTRSRVPCGLECNVNPVKEPAILFRLLVDANCHD
jgi:putative transcriptional regulator